MRWVDPGLTACLALGKYPWPVFSPRGPSVRELAVQALSSVEGGYDLLAPKFDHTPFRTPDDVLDATAGAEGTNSGGSADERMALVSPLRRF